MVWKKGELKMIEVGKNQILEVMDEDKSGYYLVCDENKEVFLPGSLVKENIQIGDKVKVFIYFDKDGNGLATAILPKAEVDDFACLKVKSVTPHGAFLDLGLPKDILVPRKLQQFDMQVGQIHLIKILLEEGSMRLYGTSKINSYVETKSIPFRQNDGINLIPYHKTPLGYKILIENKYLGMIYHTEIFSPVVLGKEYRGCVKNIQEGGKIDALLQESGIKGIQTNSEKILEALRAEGGRLDLWDKSSPEDIEKRLHMSKSSFKKTIGTLYKNRQITLGQGFIELIAKV